MKKYELLKLLRGKSKLFAWVAISQDYGSYVQLVKSHYIEVIKELPEYEEMPEVSLNEGNIYLN